MTTDEQGLGSPISDQDKNSPAPDEAIYLGKQLEVYDAELFGASHAINTLTLAALNEVRPPRDIWIFLDNAAAIQRLQHLRPGPGQRVASAVHQVAKELTKNNIKLHIHWVPGHTNVPGNEKADALAKEGAALGTADSTSFSLAWLKRQARRETYMDWMDEWDTSKHGRSYEGEPRRKLTPFTAQQPVSSPHSSYRCVPVMDISGHTFIVSALNASNPHSANAARTTRPPPTSSSPVPPFNGSARP